MEIVCSSDYLSKSTDDMPGIVLLYPEFGRILNNKIVRPRVGGFGGNFKLSSILWLNASCNLVSLCLSPAITSGISPSSPSRGSAKAEFSIERRYRTAVLAYRFLLIGRLRRYRRASSGVVQISTSCSKTLFTLAREEQHSSRDDAVPRVSW